jgi:hypothetical protein
LPITAPGQFDSITATLTGQPFQGIVNWPAPDSGNSPILNYTITPYQNGTALDPITVSGSPSPPTFLVVNNLAVGIPYTFAGLATNAVGSGPLSVQSNPITATQPTPPPTPTAPTAGRPGTTYQYVFRGKSTLMLYKFANSAIPSTLLDPAGNILEYGPYNGETIVLCAQDGEVRRSVKGTPGPSDPYGFGIASSPWESNV